MAKALRAIRPASYLTTLDYRYSGVCRAGQGFTLFRGQFTYVQNLLVSCFALKVGESRVLTVIRVT